MEDLKFWLTSMAILSATLGTAYYTMGRECYNPSRRSKKIWISSLVLSGVSLLTLFFVQNGVIAENGASKDISRVAAKIEEKYGYTQINKGRETTVIIKNVVLISPRDKGYQVFFEENSDKIGQLFLRYADKVEIIKDVSSGNKAWIQYNGKLFGWNFIEMHVPEDFEPAKFFR